MKREASKLIWLGKFKITPAEIGEIVRKIEGQGNERKVSLQSISVNIENNVLTYENVDELRNDRVWENRIIKFNLWFSEIEGNGNLGHRRISIGGGISADNAILVSGEDVGWVVGTGEHVQKIMKRYEVWYKYFAKEMVVTMVYPSLIFILGVLFIFSEWTTSIIEESGIFGIGKDSGWPFILLLTMTITIFIAVSICSYWIPVGSKIVEDVSVEKRTAHRNFWLGFLGILATLFIGWLTITI